MFAFFKKSLVNLMLGWYVRRCFSGIDNIKDGGQGMCPRKLSRNLTNFFTRKLGAMIELCHPSITMKTLAFAAVALRIQPSTLSSWQIAQAVTKRYVSDNPEPQ